MLCFIACVIEKQIFLIKSTFCFCQSKRKRRFDTISVFICYNRRSCPGGADPVRPQGLEARGGADPLGADRGGPGHDPCGEDRGCRRPSGRGVHAPRRPRRRGGAGGPAPYGGGRLRRAGGDHIEADGGRGRSAGHPPGLCQGHCGGPDGLLHPGDPLRPGDAGAPGHPGGGRGPERRGVPDGPRHFLHPRLLCGGLPPAPGDAGTAGIEETARAQADGPGAGPGGGPGEGGAAGVAGGVDHPLPGGGAPGGA